MTCLRPYFLRCLSEKEIHTFQQAWWIIMHTSSLFQGASMHISILRAWGSPAGKTCLTLIQCLWNKLAHKTCFKNCIIPVSISGKTLWKMRTYNYYKQERCTQTVTISRRQSEKFECWLNIWWYQWAVINFLSVTMRFGSGFPFWLLITGWNIHKWNDLVFGISFKMIRKEQLRIGGFMSQHRWNCLNFFFLKGTTLRS